MRQLNPLSASRYNTAVVIGRFQPWHLGHLALVRHALALADRVVVVLGSAFHARNVRNPFTWEERRDLGQACLSAADALRVDFVPVRDYYDDQRWAAAVRTAVASGPGSVRGRTALVGYLKDASTCYLEWFPEWDRVTPPQATSVDATAVRDVLFTAESLPPALLALRSAVPEPVRHYLAAWARLPGYRALRAEYAQLAQERQTYPAAIYVTADAVVTTAGHVLLVRRGRSPGQGLYALPGGFVEPRERVLQTALRELREETGLGLVSTTLLQAQTGSAVFDHPDRSVRGRVITHAFHFDLKMDRVPEVVGRDDAEAAQFIEIGKLAAMEAEFFDDHFHVLNHFLHIVP